MARENYNDLHAFLLVAREQSFTKAAARLGISQSALSHTIRGLENKLGFSLLTRTTRSVAPTEAGERLLMTIGPRFEEIETELSKLTSSRNQPAGTVRIAAAQQTIESLLWPRLKTLLRQHPDIRLELIAEPDLIDVATEGCDVHVRNRHPISETGMSAVRIGPDTRLTIVGSPAYLAERGVPSHPDELVHHRCINRRLPMHGRLFVWPLEKEKTLFPIHMDGQLIFNDSVSIITACLEGFGLACLDEDSVRDLVAKGRLLSVLDDWCPLVNGCHLYYPHRMQSSPALQLVIAALRCRC